MSQSEKLKRSKTYRKSCISELSVINSLAIRAKTDKSMHTLFKVRYEEINDIREDFQKHHNGVISTIMSLPDGEADLDTEDVIRQGFLEEFFAIKTIYTDLFQVNQPQTVASGVNSGAGVSTSASHIRLPKIELTKFSGDYKSFPSFLDLYDALVHNNQQLSDTEKFNYLVSTLQGQPLSLIRHLPITSDNYNIAYTSLVDRYSNKKLRAQAHYYELDRVSKISSDNPTALRNLLDIYSENLAALEQLGLPVQEWDFLITMMLMQRVDSTLLTKFELDHGSTEIPDLDTLRAFLNKHCIALETLTCSNSRTKRSSDSTVCKADRNFDNRLNNRSSSAFFVNKSPANNCIFCNENHSLYTCSAFNNKSPRDRYNLCKSLQLCVNCLSASHDQKNCRSQNRCKKCARNHHTLLHFDSPPTPTASASSLPRSSNNNNAIHANTNTFSRNNMLSSSPNANFVASHTTHAPENTTSTSHLSTNSVCLAGAGSEMSSYSNVLLSTAWLEVLDSRGVFQPLRCFLDTGSMTSFITERAMTRLGLPKIYSRVEVKGLSSTKTCVSKGRALLSIKPLGKYSPILHTEALILNKICDELPSSRISIDTWSHISHIQLADNKFNVPGAIDLLIGADLFPRILLDGIITGNKHEPCAINTVFGYILMGQLPSAANGVSSFFANFEESPDLEATIKRFWQVEEIPSITLTNPDDEFCTNYFKNTYFRDSNGRYTVSLPFKELHPTFPGIRDLAINRFLSLEKRLMKNPELNSLYKEFMLDYLESNHMSPVSTSDIPDNVYYIPHHGVLKPDSLTTKLRVVFNGSAKLPGQKSLNDCLHIGPKLQQDIVTILLSFRCHEYVLCSDVRQMYRMININPCDKNYQRIVFRFSPDESIGDFVLNTVVYGLSPSPYLALACLLQLAEDEGHDFPLAAEAIRSASYIDDFLCGASTLETARNLRSQLISLLQRGGFELRKWSSNHPALLSDLPPSHLSSDPRSFELDSSLSLKVLGMQWKPNQDTFSFLIKPIDSRTCTKRIILSELARMYDPLGFLSPITFLAKYLIQCLWTSGIGWDDTPSSDIIRTWNQYKSELHLLANIDLPRKLSSPNSITYEIHGFCDASMRGFSSVIYLRTISSDSSITMQFICSKSKIAPLKNISIPRLELCAAVLLSKLLSLVMKIFKNKITFQKMYAWSDSQITLHWLRSSPHRFKTFVGNRVAYIQDRVPPSSWYYIESKNNAADVASRGLLPSELLSNHEWFHGPDFLKNDDISPWLEKQRVSTIIALPDEENRKLTFFTEPLTQSFIDFLLAKYSSFATLQRVLAYMLRFISNCRTRKRKESTLQSSELYNSLLVLIKRTQHIAFADELENKRFSKPLRKLNIFIDKDGLLRVGGRLEYASLPHDQKHPFLLPRQSHLTTLLINYYHQKYLHAGFRTTHFLLSQTFWILSSRRAINSVLTKCIRCWKTKPKPFTPFMGNLPVSRISQLKPFANTGVDFGGPFTLTMTRHRGIRTCKGYLCLFICFATKAIHLELASDLSAEMFLAALQRFIARRGRVSHLWSDGGTNFGGGSRELAVLMKNAANHENIEHSVIPPGSPHFGGLWESGIKSVKTHLTRVIGQQVLTYEEFYTILTIVESVLNSRPLGPLTCDIEDINALTPNHFLNLEPSSPIPLPDFTTVNINRLSRWQMIQKLSQELWRRWNTEYLHTLQQRSKWLKSNGPSPAVGSLVLIKDENLPLCKWALARIITLHPGKDSVSRVATVKTANGTLKRPLVKLCPFPDPPEEPPLLHQL